MSIHYTDSTVTLHQGDCLDVLRSLPDASVDAVVTDPPYGLEFMGKGWDAPWRESDVNADAGMSETGYTDGGNRLPRPSFTGSTNPKCLVCKGTRRGRRDGTAKVAVCLCDDGGRFPNVRAVEMRAFAEWCETWTTELYRVLKPGGHMLAFGGTRTSHRLACAIEDAGFEIRDSIAWLYGSGFPKSLDVSKAIDKRGGNAHLADEIGAAIKAARESRGWTAGQADRHFCGGSTNWTWFEGRKGMCRPPTPADFARIATEWPELAPWAEQVAEAEREVTGKARWNNSANHFVPGEDHTQRVNLDITAPATDDARTWQGWGTALKPAHEPIVVARKPLAGTVAANVLAHGTGALNVDGCRVEGEAQPFGNGTKRTAGIMGTSEPRGAWGPTSAGRWPANVILDEQMARELDAQSGVLTSGKMLAGTKPKGERETYGQDAAGGYETAHDTPGDTGGASRFFYVAKADASERVRVNGTAHPTVKPLALMRWLVRLVTPPGGTVLEPFAGSGTTVEACILEGFRCVAIEREADYLPLIQQRIHRRRDPVAAVKAAGDDGGLFDLLDDDGAA